MAGGRLRLVAVPRGDPVVGTGPHLLDQPVVQLPGPLLPQELHDLLAALHEGGPVSPPAVGRIRHRDGIRVLPIPRVLGAPNLLDGALGGERRQRWLLIGGHQHPLSAISGVRISVSPRAARQ